MTRHHPLSISQSTHSRLTSLVPLLGLLVACQGGSGDKATGDAGGGDSGTASPSGCAGYDAWDMYGDPFDRDPYTRGRGWYPPNEPCLASCSATGFVDADGLPWTQFTFGPSGSLVLLETGGEEYQANGTHGYRMTSEVDADGLLVSEVEERDRDQDGSYESLESIGSRDYGTGSLVANRHSEHYNDGDTTTSDSHYTYEGDAEQGRPSARESLVATTEEPEEHRGSRREYEYEDDRLMLTRGISSDGEPGDTKVFHWSSEGRIDTATLTRSDGDEFVYRLEYGAHGGVTAFISDDDPDDSTTYVYDGEGKLVQVVASDGSSLSYAWTCP
jgi:YD repeat-containing protein